jgi:hypothetical protein
MAWYKVQWNYRSGLWPEPLEKDRVLDITDEQAAALNADSPGVVEPVKMVEDKPKPKARVVEAAPKTTAKKSPVKRTGK